jgi:para-aminobenzoate synthetase component 1
MDRLRHFAKNKIPFAFVLSYDKSELVVEPLDKLEQIAFSVSNKTVFQNTPLRKTPVDYATYKTAYDKVIDNIKEGNTYLLNLTFATRLDGLTSLANIYTKAAAKYKVMLKDRFVAFSPETFVQIQNDTIATYPMKGTICALVPNAKETLLNDAKESAEHTMIVDLLRNDLGIVGQNVKVERFRYVEDIGGLLQVSSKISAKVPCWEENLASIIDAITPAGSITGTPKKSTCTLIEQIETDSRGYYTGIFGVYDGKSFDSCVLIRYVEKNKNGFFYRSGGGITLDSDAKSEYQEMIDKVYLPQEKTML